MSKKGCIQCCVPNANGGSPDRLLKLGIIPDLEIEYEFLKYSVQRCNQCGRYQLFNGKVFEPLLVKQIPAVQSWEHSIERVEQFAQVFDELKKNPIDGGIFGGVCSVRTKVDRDYHDSLVVLSSWPLSGPNWENIGIPMDVVDIKGVRRIDSKSKWWDEFGHLPRFVFRFDVEQVEEDQGFNWN